MSLVGQKRKFDANASEESCGDAKRKNQEECSLDSKISRLLNAVLDQGDIGKLVIITDENNKAYVSLQNAVSYYNMNISVIREDTNPRNFELQINGTKYASGTFQNIQLAKNALGEETLEKLKQTCFFIYKKKDYVNVTKQNLETTNQSTSNAITYPKATGGIAQLIMLKMGWGGKGLGAQEQGNVPCIVLYENVNRQGLGSVNLRKEITKKLEDFSKSSNLLSLVFDEEFTKEERVLIHQIARKYNLKSRSAGSNSRKVTVSKKITKMDIVKELLKQGGEDGLYKLHIPTKFLHLWD